MLMPVFRLTNELIFPPPELADPDGLLAVGGDLSQRKAACSPIPWEFFPGMIALPILWWSPEPRFILELE